MTPRKLNLEEDDSGPKLKRERKPRKAKAKNYCTKCECYFAEPGTCNCFAVKPIDLSPYVITTPYISNPATTTITVYPDNTIVGPNWTYVDTTTIKGTPNSDGGVWVQGSVDNDTMSTAWFTLDGGSTTFTSNSALNTVTVTTNSATVDEMYNFYAQVA